MPITNNNTGLQNVGMQQANESGSHVTSHPQIGMGGGGATANKPGLIPEDLWKAAHAQIRPGLYHIVNRFKGKQLLISQFEAFARSPVESIAYNPQDTTTPGKKWEVRRGGVNHWDLALLSANRFLQDGPHVFAGANTVRMIPVPNRPGSYYISPNLGEPTVIITDVGPAGGVYPVTSTQLRNLHEDNRDAQWELVPV